MIRRLRARSALAAALLLSSTAATAQVVNPAHAQQPPVAGERPGDAEEPPNATRLRSWELPAETVVTGERLARYFEEDRVGSYGQPRWTAKRLFPTTRVYVVPAGKLEVEHWTRVKTPKEGPTTVENQAELEIGLPHRFQVDIYYATEKSGREGDLGVSAQKFEVRHALADWGELPLNPTVYVEWVENDAAADAMELKLLLGEIGRASCRERVLRLV